MLLISNVSYVFHVLSSLITNIMMVISVSVSYFNSLKLSSKFHKLRWKTGIEWRRRSHPRRRSTRPREWS